MDFEDFYGRYVDRVASYVLRHASLRDADDIVAETFTVAWRKRIERLDDPMPWLIVTARNITRQVRRKEVSAGEITARLIDLIETASPSAEITALRRREITDALASLDEVSREALLLTTWDGLSGVDAARVLGITAGALRVRVHRARTTMKEVSVHD
jgi:RNA polymerase sigma-70 factor (ECF subfamily)